MNIKFLYETTSLTLQNIADKLGIPFSVVFSYVKKHYSKEHRTERKSHCYRNSKLGSKNPMFGKKMKRLICSVCNKNIAINIAKKYHFENCKS